MDIKKISLTGIFAALIAVGAFVKIPAAPVPVTLQSFFVLLSGILLGSKWGMLSVLVYIILGILGFPVFTSGGGIMYVLHPTFGFLIGFLASSFFAGALFRDKRISWLRAYLCLIPTYVIGILYYIMVLKFFSNKNIDFYEILYTGYVLFIPADVMKCIAVQVFGKKLRAVLSKQ